MTTIEERLAVLSRLPSDVICLLDRDGVISYVSPSIERTLGYTAEAYRTIDALELVHPDDQAIGVAEWTFVIENPDAERRWKLRMRAADGGWRWVEVVAVNALDDPTVGAIFTNFRDITEQSDAEVALRASEARLKAILDNSRDVAAVLAVDGSITWISEGVIDIVGVEATELVGTSAFDLLHPDDVVLAIDRFRIAIDDAPSIDPIEVRVDHGDGTWLPVEIAGTAIEGDQGFEGVVVNVRNIRWRIEAEEVRRQAEERFRALVQNSHDAVVVVDDTGQLIYMSPSVEHLFGADPARTLGASGFDWLHPDDHEAAVTALASIAEPGARASIQARVRGASGYRWVEVVAVNLIDNPAVGGIVINIRDVTERQEAQHALLASEEKFRSLVQYAGAVVEILDDYANVRWCSQSIEEVLGWPLDEVVGHWCGELAHPDDTAANIEAFLEAAKEPGATRSAITRVRHRDGTWRWMECSYTNRRSDPTITGMVGTFRDITDQRLAEQAVRESERLFRSLARSSPVGVFQQNGVGDCIYVNRRWQEITGFSVDDALGTGWRRIVHPDDRERLAIDVDLGDDRPPQAPPAAAEFRVVRPDGEVRWVSVHTAPVFDDDQMYAGNVGAMEDITERVEAQRDSQRLTDIFEATRDLVGIADSEGAVLYLNRASREFFGLSRHENVEGFNLLEHLSTDVAARVASEVRIEVDSAGIWTGEMPLVRPDGVTVPHMAQILAHRDEAGSSEFFSAILRDISERKAFEHRLNHQATHDPLTGMPNRVLLLDRLEQALARARRAGRRLGVLFLDLDHFKVVNDSLGHGLGDRLLVAIAARLEAALRPGDTIARFGGDEFVVLCEDLASRADAIAIATRVNESISGPFLVDEAEVFVGVSIGIAFPDSADAEPETLIRDADAAMYQAKERGRGRFVIFDNAMRAHAVDRLDIENALRRAIDRREMRVHYQPIVSLASGRIDGVEALLRWEHPERGLLAPGDFITVAEETGLIVPIGRWVLEQSCRQLQRWKASAPGLERLGLSVNLSGRQLGHAGLVDDVATIISETGIDPSLLELEITESVLMDDVEMSADTLGRLKTLGVKLAVDDFGTGYSSLSYLRRFPVDQLKVDRSFVDGLGHDPGDSAIVTAIVTLAHALGLRSVAEGVETAEQLAELRHLGCDRAQGFHLARPGSSEPIAALLASNPQY